MPASAIGLSFSEMIPQTELEEGMIRLADPLLFSLIQKVVMGDVPATHAVILHPIGYAGWVGLFVTALNLLPLSQLDGGHITYGLFGKRRIYIVIATYAIMAAVAVIFRSWNWLVWGAITLVFGFRHPPAEDEITPLSAGDIIIGIASLMILVLTVMPVPIKIVQ